MIPAIVLTLIGLGFVLAEVFFPSMGLLGLIATCCILSADFLAFGESQAVGWGFVAAHVILIPTVIWLGFRALPHLSFGRRMLLEGPATEPGAGLPDLGHLVGCTGVALTSLRPAGMARFGDERVSVVSLGGLIDRDTPISVVEVEGAEVRVRPTADNESTLGDLPDRQARR